MRELILTGVVIFLLNACTFSAPQFESAMALAKSIGQGGSSDGSEQAAVWLATVNGTGAVLTPYESQGFIVFANTDGDAIAFDGWIIRSVTGFGLSTPLSVSGKEGERMISVAGGTSKINCRPWVWQPLAWRQSCDQGPSEILLSDEGSIQRISMSLGASVGTVDLRVAD